MDVEPEVHHIRRLNDAHIIEPPVGTMITSDYGGELLGLYLHHETGWKTWDRSRQVWTDPDRIIWGSQARQYPPGARLTTFADMLRLGYPWVDDTRPTFPRMRRRR